MHTKDKKEIYQNFVSGDLTVKSSSLSKKVEWKQILDVTKHNVLGKKQYDIEAGSNSCKTTGDHSLFIDNGNNISEKKTGSFKIGDPVIFVDEDKVVSKEVTALREAIIEPFMYDLTVKDNQNFVLESGFLAHNTFRPPASERFIQSQTQVFGFIWEDEELYEYLLWAIDDFNTRPPVTGLQISDIYTGAPQQRWRPAILLRAGAFACFAITMNWIADEFSVGGEEKIAVKCSPEGEKITLPIDELFNIIYEEEFKKVQDNLKEAIEVLENDITA